MASTAKPAKASSPSKKDPAAAAALIVTRAQPPPAPKAAILDADGKLSSASAATSLKHAKPHDLPSYPIVGLTNPESSAGAAASLAAANPKTIEHWKPDPLPAANKAAYLAKDYKAEPLWQPEQSSAGSRAAILAHRNRGDVEIWRAEPTPEGNSAAGQAMRKKDRRPSTDNDETGRARTAAAHGAMASGRYAKPFPPVPPPDYSYPDAVNSAANALSAASKAAHAPRPRKIASVPTDLPGLSAQDARRIHDAAVTNLSRDMYTANPPVAPEVEERNYQAGLNAAAISMAKAMYATQQKLGEDSRKAALTAAGRKSSPTEEPAVKTPQQYLHLQDTARRLAAERLSKMQDGDAAYRSYYGQEAPKRGFSLRHRRQSSGSVDMTDPERARKIRSQMSGLQSSVQQVDERKRRNDREALLAAAQRNVRQSMHGMDEKVFAETGKASPAMQAEWEKKARERAKEKSDARMANYGKVDIGGGKYLDQSEIDAIAAARVQPTLDQISEKAAADRARDEALRQQAEQRKADLEEKQRVDKERSKTTDLEWKRFKDDEKAEKKRQKDEEKARKEEEKKRQKEKVEEVQWQKVRDKERAKEEKAAAQKAEEEQKRAEREKSAKLAAEYEAIQAEEKRKSKEEKRKSKEAKQKEKEDQKDQKEAEQILASATKEIDEEEKAAKKEQERAEKEATKALEKENKDREWEEKQERKEAEEEEKQRQKEEREAAREAEEEKEEKEDAAQKIHEIAEQVRSQARQQALMQYLKDTEKKVHDEQEAEAEAEKKRQEELKIEQEQKQKEETERIDREIAEVKKRREEERKKEKLEREQEREQQRERDQEQKEYEKKARELELEKIDREIDAEKERKEHEHQEQDLKKDKQEEDEAWWKEGEQKPDQDAKPVMTQAEKLHEYERTKAEVGVVGESAAVAAAIDEVAKYRPDAGKERASGDHARRSISAAKRTGSVATDDAEAGRSPSSKSRNEKHEKTEGGILAGTAAGVAAAVETAKHRIKGKDDAPKKSNEATSSAGEKASSVATDEDHRFSASRSASAVTDEGGMTQAQKLHKYESEKAHAGVTAGTAEATTKRHRLQKGKAKEEPAPAKAKEEESKKDSLAKESGRAKEEKVGVVKRASLLVKREGKGKDKKTSEERSEDKDNRRSKGLGLGAVAAAIGVGDRETKKEKAEKTKEQVPSEPDSEASTPLTSEGEDEDEDAGAAPGKAGTGIPDAREKDFGQHEQPVEERVALPADVHSKVQQQSQSEQKAASRQQSQTRQQSRTRQQQLQRDDEERLRSSSQGRTTTTIVGGTAVAEAEAKKKEEEKKSIDGKDRKLVITGKAKEKVQEKKEQEKETKKREGWFRRLSRRGSKPAEKMDSKPGSEAGRSDGEKDKKPHKLQKTSDRAATPDPNDGKHVIEPVTGLAVDVTKTNPGFGTDGIPHIQPAESDTKEEGAAGASQTESTDAGAGTATSTTAADASAAVPQSTSNALTDASPGRPNISAPITKHAIQNSAGFSAESGTPAGALTQPRPALEPGIPPASVGSTRAVALARADDGGGSSVYSSVRHDAGSVTDDSDAEDMRRRAAQLQQEHGAVLGHTRDEGQHRPFARRQRQLRDWSPDSSEDEGETHSRPTVPAESTDTTEEQAAALGIPVRNVLDVDLHKEVATVDHAPGAAQTDSQGTAAFRKDIEELMGRLDRMDGAGGRYEKTAEGSEVVPGSAGSDGDEAFQEARDRLDSLDGPLAPPAPIRDAALGRGTPSPVRETRFKEELSE